jgi:hypothetical protein
MGGALWRYGTQEEGCTNHSCIHSSWRCVAGRWGGLWVFWEGDKGAGQ